jgi:hypothetical protein
LGALDRPHDMEKVLVFVGVTVGSYIGWIIGARINFFTAFVLSIIGTAIGLYSARRFVRENL